ncbi:MAG: hypothetical protein ACE5Q6_19235, partial [Dehalococcoidia bacterium]
MAPRLLEIDCNRDEGLTVRVRPGTLNLLTESTRGHLRAANKELLLALRSVIDSAIEWTERQEHRDRRPRRIQVRVGDIP